MEGREFIVCSSINATLLLLRDRWFKSNFSHQILCGSVLILIGTLLGKIRCQVLHIEGCAWRAPLHCRVILLR